MSLEDIDDDFRALDFDDDDEDDEEFQAAP